MSTLTFDYAQLCTAIDRADAPSLRAMLKTVCKDSADMRKQAAKHLLAAPASNKRKAVDDGTSGIKRQAMTSRYERCVTCHATFDVTKNHDAACQTHDDLVTVDEEYFPDDDDITYGDTYDKDWTKDWRFKEFPQGFIWQCCEGRADEDPCVIQRHIAAGQTKQTKQALPSTGRTAVVNLCSSDNENE